jgi:membrane protease YdiL (CAAX protease family)
VGEVFEKNHSGLIESLLYFLGGALVLYVAVHNGIPHLQNEYSVSPLIGWWLTSGVIVLGLFLAAVLAARRTNAKSLRQILIFLNVRSMNKIDLLWALGGLLGVVVLTSIVITVFNQIFSINLLSQESYASFLRMEKVKPDEYWIFLAWMPYFFFNIVGEELLWRGYLLPRQIDSLGHYAWILNGFLWAIFHVGIGWRIAIILLPIEFIVPFVVQKRKNTWLGIIIHGFYNGCGFIMVALGIFS